MQRDPLQNLLSKYIKGNIKPEEFLQLKEQLNVIGEQDLQNILEDMWHKSSYSSAIPLEDKQHIINNIHRDITTKKSKRMSFRWLIIAAAAIALAITSYFVVDTLQNNTLQNWIVSVEKGDKAKILLPDGSSVWLNSTSELTYGSNFNIKNRNVKIDGEAFFDVKNNSQLPFVVDLEQISIEVIGTRFNVKFYKDEDIIDIALVEGKISIYDTDQKLLSEISPNQKIIFNKSDLNWEIQTCNAELEQLWTDYILKFENATLDEIAIKLERWYGVNINYETNDKDIRLGLTIKSESLNETLQLINRMVPMYYTIDGEEVYMRFE